MTETLWTIEHVAAYLVLSPSATEHALGQPGAPKPIVLPSRGTGKRAPKRYVPEEVREWALNQARAA